MFREGSFTHRDESNANVVAVRVHLALLLAIDQIVVVLHADELMPAAVFGDILQRLEFPGVHLPQYYVSP